MWDLICDCCFLCFAFDDWKSFLISIDWVWWLYLFDFNRLRQFRIYHRTALSMRLSMSLMVIDRVWLKMFLCWSTFSKTHFQHFFSTEILHNRRFQLSPFMVPRTPSINKHQWLSMKINTPCQNAVTTEIERHGHLQKSTLKVQVQLVISICACILGGNTARCKTVGEKTLWESRHKNLGTH